MSRSTTRIDRVREMGDEFSPLEQLYVAAGVSLSLTNANVADAMIALVDRGDPGEVADILHARALEMLALLPGIPEPMVAGIGRAREQIELRRGTGFLARVSAMGRPAAEVLNAEAFVALNADTSTSRRIH